MDAKIVKNDVLSLFYGHFDGVAEIFSDCFSNGFGDSDDVAGRAHLHDLSSIGNAVECGIDQQSAFPIERLDVVWNLHVGSVHIFILYDYGIKC